MLRRPRVCKKRFQTSSNLLLDDLEGEILRYTNEICNATGIVSQKTRSNSSISDRVIISLLFAHDSSYCSTVYLFDNVRVLYVYSSQLRKLFETDKQCKKTKNHVSRVLVLSLQHPSYSISYKEAVKLCCFLSFSKVHMQPRLRKLLLSIRQNIAACSQQRQFQQTQSL